MKGQGREISHFGLEKGPKGLRDAFYGCEKIEKTFYLCDLFIFQRHSVYSSLKGCKAII